MRFKSLITLILSISLAVLTSSAMAKSSKSAKSDKSSRHSEKSAKSEKSGKSQKSAKSRKRGNGYGHCKSDKSGKGHKKKRGRGHNRDCDDNEEPPVLTCSADVSEFITMKDIFDSRDNLIGTVTDTITYEGKICAEGDEIDYEADQIVDGGDTICEANAGSNVSARQESSTEYWYATETVLTCRANISN